MVTHIGTQLFSYFVEGGDVKPLFVKSSIDIRRRSIRFNDSFPIRYKEAALYKQFPSAETLKS